MTIKKWKNLSIILSILLGTLLHFTYKLSGNNSFIALFSSINESVWEHLKLSFFPMTIFAIIGYFIFHDKINNYVSSQIIGILFSIIFTIITFYTYSGILGTNYTLINILIFALSIFYGENITYYLIKHNKLFNTNKLLIFFSIITLLFFIFTFNPPKIELFKDPLNGSYGVLKHF